MDVIESHLESFSELLSAEEVVLFERTTFLVVSHISRPSQGQILDPQRFEKVSSIIKSFKLSCGYHSPLTHSKPNSRKLNSEFLSFELRTGAFSAFIDRLTPTTQIMIIIADPTIGIPSLRSFGDTIDGRIGCDDDEFGGCEETF
jgi:Ras-related GTP-binding protein A/B